MLSQLACGFKDVFMSAAHSQFAHFRGREESDFAPPRLRFWLRSGLKVVYEAYVPMVESCSPFPSLHMFRRPKVRLNHQKLWSTLYASPFVCNSLSCMIGRLLHEEVSCRKQPRLAFLEYGGMPSGIASLLSPSLRCVRSTEEYRLTFPYQHET